MRYSKSWTQALQEVQEQVGVRKVDFVDGVTPDLQEAKPEFEVKYASSKKGPIKVSKFMSLEDAKKFLAQVKKEGMNGIISKGGKPVKEALDDEDKPVVKKVVKMLKKASQAHAGQADDLEKSMKEHHEKDANGEPIPHDDEEGNAKLEEVEPITEKDVAIPASIDNLKKIVKDKQNAVFMFKDGKVRVDLFSASALVQVYDALKPATKKKFEDMIQTKGGFVKAVDFAFSMAKK